MNIQNYPLSWPPGFPRTKHTERGQFRTAFNGARENVEKSLTAFARDSGKVISNLVISSNQTIGGSEPNDPGVAVWFSWNDMQVCIPVDRYASVASNLQAIHHIIEARRVELRHGTLALVRATFTGFQVLPAPAGEHWRDVLALLSDTPTTKDAIESAYKRLSLVRHPDKGGSTEAMAELNNAKATALREIGA
ncbi:MAG: hypothetical protein A49_03650 [Methyloceanibacter sp.]|nr:MAG: hypothetical protein A49_03650 [Methyloceanibacter sp.]